MRLVKVTLVTVYFLSFEWNLKEVSGLKDLKAVIPYMNKHDP